MSEEGPPFPLSWLEVSLDATSEEWPSAAPERQNIPYLLLLPRLPDSKKVFKLKCCINKKAENRCSKNANSKSKLGSFLFSPPPIFFVEKISEHFTQRRSGASQHMTKTSIISICVYILFQSHAYIFNSSTLFNNVPMAQWSTLMPCNREAAGSNLSGVLAFL